MTLQVHIKMHQIGQLWQSAIHDPLHSSNRVDDDSDDCWLAGLSLNIVIR